MKEKKHRIYTWVLIVLPPLHPPHLQVFNQDLIGTGVKLVKWESVLGTSVKTLTSAARSGSPLNATVISVSSSRRFTVNYFMLLHRQPLLSSNRFKNKKNK